MKKLQLQQLVLNTGNNIICIWKACTKSRLRYITIPMAPSGIIAPGPAAGGAGAGTLVPPIAPLLFMPMVPGKENWGIVLAHNTQWLGSAHHPRATEHCSMQGQSPSLFTSFALWGQDKLILLYSTLCFLSHEYFLLLAQEISLTEFLNKKPIKWDHWKKKSADFVREEMNMHRNKEYSYLPYPSVPFACLVAPSGKTDTHFNW